MLGIPHETRGREREFFIEEGNRAPVAKATLKVEPLPSALGDMSTTRLYCTAVSAL